MGVLAGALSVCTLSLPTSLLNNAVLHAQTTGGTLAGTVTDKSGAAIPGATIKLRNTVSGDIRTITANEQGFFNFAGVPTGDYAITITGTGFQQLQESGIHLDPGDNRTLPQLQLQAGEVSSVVNVEAQTDAPLDTGERSDLITAEEIKHLSVEGRDVTELFKTLPGFAISNGSGGVTNSAYDPSQVNVSGALGNYAANGNPIGGVSLRLDGADITDPGNYGAAIQNVNYDQVGEVKVQVSNFAADTANGPVVVSAVTTQGGNHFHGSLYTYARTYQLDSTDALAKATGSAKDPDREVYPGFTVGGPVIVPGTSFNKNRHFTFFAGAEQYAQRNIYAYGGAAGALIHALVPTAAMRQGNFSSTELQNYLGPQLYANSAYQNISVQPTYAKDGTRITGGILPSTYADPGFAQIYAGMPLPNQTATLANPYNYQAQNFIDNNLWQVLGRVDVAISERNHLFARYTVERGKSGEPGALYYNQGELNTPGGGLSTVNSESAAANLTTILSSTLTNQLFGSFGYLNQSFVSKDPSALTGFAYKGAYADSRNVVPQLQNYDDASGLPRQLTPDYSLSPIFAHKFDPTGGDTLTKVWGTHTATFGVYVQKVINNEKAANQATNGYLNQYYLPGAGSTFTDVAPAGTTGATYYTSGNWVANNFQGEVSGYGQQNLLPDTNLYFWNNDFFAQDSWKITSRLTFNYGLRVEHLGLWNDAYGAGVAIFDPTQITSASSLSPFPGFLWHGIDPSLPTSGNKSKAFFYEPRVGFAFDALGTGKTVIRGGWGEYRSHDSWNDATNAVNVTQNTQSVNLGGGGLTLAGVSNLNLVSNPVTGTNNYNAGTSTTLGGAAGTLFGITKGDTQQPLTDTYSLTINQALPRRMNLLIGYVGNNSRFLLNGGSNQTVALDNINAVPIGGLYRPNPNTNSPCYGQVLTPTGITPAGAICSSTTAGLGTSQMNDYRPLNTPLVHYGALDVPSHVLSANYNGVQLGLTRQTGRVLFNVNYTFSKSLGILGGNNNGEPANPFDLQSNYGPEAFDRTHILNASYTFEVGNPVHEKVLAQFTNGWEISGISNLQSGPNITSTLSNPGFGLSGNIGHQYLDAANSVANPNYITINNTVYLGTNDVSLQPTLLCNPRSGLGKNQFINGNCLGTPNLLQNGPYQYPYLRGPAYFDTDLSAQKSFKTFREQSLMFRFSAFNFINHALTTFTGDFPNQYTLNATNTAGTTFNQGVNDAALGFGTASYKTGRRVVELMAKYTF